MTCLRQGLLVFAACVLIFTFAIPTLAQYTNGAISGIVYDPGGAVVTGAPVTIQNQATGYSKTTRTAADGAFLFPATPVGVYQVVVEKPGFSRYVQSGITVAVPTSCNLFARIGSALM